MIVEVEHIKDLPDGNKELEIIFTYQSDYIPKKGDYLKRGGHELKIIDEPVHLISTIPTGVVGQINPNLNRQTGVRVRV